MLLLNLNCVFTPFDLYPSSVRMISLYAHSGCLPVSYPRNGHKGPDLNTYFGMDVSRQVSP